MGSVLGTLAGTEDSANEDLQWKRSALKKFHKVGWLTGVLFLLWCRGIREFLRRWTLCVACWLVLGWLENSPALALTGLWMTRLLQCGCACAMCHSV